MGIFKKLTAWNMRNRQALKNLPNSLASKAASLYETAVLNPQKEMNLELAQHAFDKNKEMWDLQNQYNDPSAQRDRMEAAGFNPNYIAGGGASGTGNASGGIPQYNVQAPTVDPMSFYSKIIGAAQGLLSLRAGMANIAKIQSQTGKLGLESDYLGGSMKDRLRKTSWSAEREVTQNALGEQLYQHRGGFANIRGRGGVLTDHLNQGKGLFGQQRTALDAQIENTRARTFFQQHKNELIRKYNITTSDNVLFRMGIMALDTIGVDPSRWLKSGGEGLANYMKSK